MIECGFIAFVFKIHLRWEYCLSAFRPEDWCMSLQEHFCGSKYGFKVEEVF